MKDSISNPTSKTFRKDSWKRRFAEAAEFRSKQLNSSACLTARSAITCRSTTFRHRSSDSGCDFSCSGFSAEDRILHRVVVPAAVAACREDVTRLEIVDQVLKVGLPVFVEDHVCEPDIERVPCEDAVTAVENAALLQIAHRTFEHLVHIKLFMSPVRDFDVHRTRSFRRHGSGEVHGEPDTREDVLIFREIDPMLIADSRTIDAEIDVQDGNRV